MVTKNDLIKKQSKEVSKKIHNSEKSLNKFACNLSVSLPRYGPFSY